ncbi:MAG: hypothetical protein R3F37_13435 [Candidatus Competibacteraceae bacterium]
MAMLAISTLTEVLQSLSPTRIASVGDAAINMMGTVAALGLIALCGIRNPLKSVHRPPIRIGLITLSLMLALLIYAPVGHSGGGFR